MLYFISSTVFEEPAMNNSPNLSLPFIAPAQAQKHVTHNEAIQLLDSLVQLAVHSTSLDVPPANPNIGDWYLVADNAQDAWSGHDGEIATFQENAWMYIEPKVGWLLWVSEEELAFVCSGTAWLPLGHNTTDMLGVNTQADAINKLAVKSDAVLLSHDDVTPGSGDMRLVLNKSTPDATGSLLFQTDFSGRSELGLSGDDDFHIKVSSDGVEWSNALSIDGKTGAVSLPNTVPFSTPINLLQDSGRFGGTPEPQSNVVTTFTVPGYHSAFNGSILSAGPKYTTNSSTYGGVGPALDPMVKAFIDALHDGIHRRYGIEFYTLKVIAGTGVGLGAVVVDGVSHRMTMVNQPIPIPLQSSVNYQIFVETGSVAIAPLDQLYINGASSDTLALTSTDGWTQVTHMVNEKQVTSFGYDTSLLKIHATPGAVFYLAALAIIPGHIDLELDIYRGIIPSLMLWH
jgi:hypothetical protein